MMDLVLQAWTSSLIEEAGLLWKLGGGHSWQPGEKLKLLFAGYNGTRNTGADVRVEEMLRQVRQVLGQENLALSVMTFESKSLARIFLGDHAGAATLDLPSLSFSRSEAAPRRGGLRRVPCSRVSSPMRSPR